MQDAIDLNNKSMKDTAKAFDFPKEVELNYSDSDGVADSEDKTYVVTNTEKASSENNTAVRRSAHDLKRKKTMQDSANGDI